MWGHKLIKYRFKRKWLKTLLKYVFLVLDMETTKLWQKVLTQYNIIWVCCYNTTWRLIVIIKHVALSCTAPCSIDCSPETQILFKKHLFTTSRCLIDQFHLLNFVIIYHIPSILFCLFTFFAWSYLHMDTSWDTSFLYACVEI